MNFKTILSATFLLAFFLLSTDIFAQAANTAGLSNRQVRKQDRELNALAQADAKLYTSQQQTATATEKQFNSSAKESRRDNIASNGAARITEKSQKREKREQRKKGRARN